MTKKQYIHRPVWSGMSVGPTLGSSYKTPIRSSKSLLQNTQQYNDPFYNYINHQERIKPPAFRSLSHMRLDLPRVSSGSINSMNHHYQHHSVRNSSSDQPISKKNPLARILNRSSSSGKMESKTSNPDNSIKKSNSERNYSSNINNANLSQQQQQQEVIKKQGIPYQRPPIPIPQEDSGYSKHPPVRRVFREFSRKSLIQKVEFQSSPSLDTSIQSDIEDDNISFSSYGAGVASYDTSNNIDDDYAYVYDCNFPTPAYLIKYNEPSENIYEEVKAREGFESDDDGISSSKSSLSSSLSSLNHDSGVQMNPRKFSNRTLDFVPGKDFSSSLLHASNDSFDISLESSQNITKNLNEVKIKPILKPTKSVPIRLGVNSTPPLPPKFTINAKSTDKKEEMRTKPQKDANSKWFKILTKLPSLSNMGHYNNHNHQKSTQTTQTESTLLDSNSSKSSSNSQPRFEFTGRWEDLH